VSHIAGFGTLPFMNGLSLGALGTYAYQAIKTAGSSADLATLQNVIGQGVVYLTATAYDPNGGSLGTAGGMFGARGTGPLFVDREFHRRAHHAGSAERGPVVSDLRSVGPVLVKRRCAAGRSPRPDRLPGRRRKYSGARQPCRTAGRALKFD
jgi:hypothetical protein